MSDLPDLSRIQALIVRSPVTLAWIASVLEGQSNRDFCRARGIQLRSVDFHSRMVAEITGLENSRGLVREAILRMRIQELERKVSA